MIYQARNLDIPECSALDKKNLPTTWCGVVSTYKSLYSISYVSKHDGLVFYLLVIIIMRV
jgi:hypothetical protein